MSRVARRIFTFGAAAAFAMLLLAVGRVSDAAPGTTADAAAEAAPVPPRKPIPPDPPPMAERYQWVFVLRWEKNEVYLVNVYKTDMGEVHQTPRVMGRFALELFEGPTLIERVRFDFPMLGMEEPGDGGWHQPPRFLPNLKTRIGVVFPATKRGTRLELWDRATDRRWPLPWPPVEGVYTGDSKDASVDGPIADKP